MPSLLKSKRILNVALWRGLTLFLILSVFGKQFFGLFYFFSQLIFWPMNLYFLAEITFDLSEEQPVCVIRQSVFNKLFHVCGVQPGSTESCVLAILDTVTSCVLGWGIQMWHSLSSVATVLIYCISECFIQQLTTLAANGLPPCAQSPQIIIRLKFWKQPLLSYMAEICL